MHQNIFHYRDDFPLKVIQYGTCSESRFYLHPWTEDLELVDELEGVLIEDFKMRMGLEKLNLIELDSATFKVKF